eukprot:2885532-Pleurochrysis_carterae.AAC.1
MVDALVHQVKFVTGGVSMDTLPTADLGEVCFVGRSNVGKSSLVNMVLGRQGIAYTSKKPGAASTTAASPPHQESRFRI